MIVPGLQVGAPALSQLRGMVKRAARMALGEQQFARLESARSRRLQRRLVTQWGLPQITQRLIRERGQAVLNGPFKGMKYSEDVLLERVGSPLLIGSYESELHFVFASAPWHEYECAIDVGCGEGYYAVGMARAFGIPVIAFDTAAKERARCKALAMINGVGDKVLTRAWIDAGALSALCSGRRCFILSDCEGYENDLFAPTVVPALSCSDLLIETHDAQSPRVSQDLMARLDGSHDVESIRATPRDPSRYPELAFLGRDASAAVTEYRSAGQTWLWCRARR